MVWYEKEAVTVYRKASANGEATETFQQDIKTNPSPKVEAEIELVVNGRQQAEFAAMAHQNRKCVEA